MRPKAVQDVQTVLVEMYGDLKKKHKYRNFYINFVSYVYENISRGGSVGESCQSFFMEMISSLCFGQSSPPDHELLQYLLAIVFTEKYDREFSYLKDAQSDKVSVIRSFLLQLLLEHK